MQVQVTANMPSDFDDGHPTRTFRGRGVVHQGRGIAGVYFAVAKVPNSAGYFGHVDPTLSVIYEGPRFMISFPTLAEILGGQVDWMSYELDDLSKRKMLRLGIGQLREIGLSDPRFASQLLAGVSGELQRRPGTPAASTLVPYSALVNITSAAEASGDEMGPVLEELIELGVTSMDVELDLDTQGRLGRFAYSLSYPPKEGSDPVAIGIEMLFPEYGVDRGLRAPPANAVVNVDEYLAL